MSVRASHRSYHSSHSSRSSGEEPLVAQEAAMNDIELHSTICMWSQSIIAALDAESELVTAAREEKLSKKQLKKANRQAKAEEAAEAARKAKEFSQKPRPQPPVEREDEATIAAREAERRGHEMAVAERARRAKLADVNGNTTATPARFGQVLDSTTSTKIKQPSSQRVKGLSSTSHCA